MFTSRLVRLVVVGLLTVSIQLFINPLSHASSTITTSSATTYYVDIAKGNDNNSGTSPSAPWRTLSEVNRHTFHPGDRILLKRGDTWAGTLSLKGNGTPIEPIELSSYGRGRDPIISPGKVNSIAILINGYAGWKISHLQLQNAWAGVELEYKDVWNKKYIMIEDMVMRDINNQYNSDPTAYNHTSAGISVKTMDEFGKTTYSNAINAPGRKTALSDLIVKNVRFYDCSTGTWFGAPVTGFNHYAAMWIANLSMDNISINGGGMWGFDFHFINGGVIRNIFTNNTGYSINPFGSAGIVAAYSRNLEFIGGKIQNAHRNSSQNYDGEGFDFEGVSSNITLRNMTISHTDGAAIMVFNNSGIPDIGTVIENDSISDYGQNPGNNVSAIDFHGGTGVIRENRIISHGSSVFTGDDSGFSFVGNKIVK